MQLLLRPDQLFADICWPTFFARFSEQLARTLGLIICWPTSLVFNIREVMSVVTLGTLNARTEINSSSNGNNIQRYLEQRSSTLGKGKEKRSQRIHMMNTYLILGTQRARTREVETRNRRLPGVLSVQCHLYFFSADRLLYRTRACRELFICVCCIFPGVQHRRSFYAPSCRLPHVPSVGRHLCFCSADRLLSGTCTCIGIFPCEY